MVVLDIIVYVIDEEVCCWMYIVKYDGILVFFVLGCVYVWGVVDDFVDVCEFL